MLLQKYTDTDIHTCIKTCHVAQDDNDNKGNFSAWVDCLPLFGTSIHFTYMYMNCCLVLINRHCHDQLFPHNTRFALVPMDTKQRTMKSDYHGFALTSETLAQVSSFWFVCLFVFCFLSLELKISLIIFFFSFFKTTCLFRSLKENRKRGHCW